jgi:hypothetical protein
MRPDKKVHGKLKTGIKVLDSDYGDRVVLKKLKTGAWIKLESWDTPLLYDLSHIAHFIRISRSKK